MVHREQLNVENGGRGFTDLSQPVQEAIQRSGVVDGLCHLFIHHTSASLIITENADPDVRHDLETFMARLAPDGDPGHLHVDEGPDDMPSHIRSVLTQTSVMIPIIQGRAALGTWQGVYLWEHRAGPHLRKVTVTVM